MVPQARLVTLTPFAASGRTASGNQTYQAIQVAVGISPVDFVRLGSPLHERLQRGIAAILAINADQMAQRRDTRAKLLDAVSEIAVIKKPRRLCIVHVLHVGVDSVPIVDRDPHRAGTHDA